MSFGFGDLITIMVLEDGLKHLASHPDHLQFILKPLGCGDMKDFVGANHIIDCINFVTKNRIYLAPYYQEDLGKLPSIVTVARQGETQQFIGDYGSSFVSQAVLPPVVYKEFTISGFEDGRQSLLVPAATKIEDYVWPNIWISNGTFLAQVDHILVREGEDTKVALKKAVPEMTAFTGWKAQSGDRSRAYEVHSSMDEIEINAKLTTTGDYTVHRLLSIVTRYCLKRGRPIFNAYGLQVATFNQSMPIKEEEQPPVFSTVFTIRGKYTESWIAAECQVTDGKLDIDYIATSEGKADVELE